MHEDERGSILVIVALMLVVLLGFSALVVDVGMAYGQERKLQNALNAAALAGAQALPDTANAVTAVNNYIQLNGYSPSTMAISFSNSNNTITVAGTQTVNYVFAKVLGFSSSSIHLSAAATRSGAPQAFNYALFSGDSSQNLELNGSSDSITGSVHSNAGVDCNGANLTITGACEAPNKVSINGTNSTIGSIEASSIVTNGQNSSIGSRLLQAAPQIPMPDFSVTVENIAKQGGTYYNGDQNYNGSDVNISSSIYVNGNVNVNGSHFSGEGTIVATGNIIFDGAFVNDSSTDAVCLYSANGNIYFNGAGLDVHGILYAPHGNIIINGANQTVHGSVIANGIINNGAGLTVISNPNDLSSLPIKVSVKLTVPQ